MMQNSKLVKMIDNKIAAFKSAASGQSRLANPNNLNQPSDMSSRCMT